MFVHQDLNFSRCFNAAGTGGKLVVTGAIEAYEARAFQVQIGNSDKKKGQEVTIVGESSWLRYNPSTACDRIDVRRKTCSTS
jgi:hypothetical protein